MALLGSAASSMFPQSRDLSCSGCFDFQLGSVGLFCTLAFLLTLSLAAVNPFFTSPFLIRETRHSSQVGGRLVVFTPAQHWGGGGGVGGAIDVPSTILPSRHPWHFHLACHCVPKHCTSTCTGRSANMDSWGYHVCLDLGNQEGWGYVQNWGSRDYVMALSGSYFGCSLTGALLKRLQSNFRFPFTPLFHILGKVALQVNLCSFFPL